MVRIGVVGLGFMGTVHFHAARRVGGAAVAAVCSRDPAKRAGDWATVRGNFGPAGGAVDLTGVAAYEHFADLLADPDIDLVDLCVPTARHADMAVEALKAGKHVLVEKPIALTLADAGAMTRAAADAGKLLMVGHVLPYFPAFGYAAEAVRDGRFGKLVAAHLSRVISRPDWSAAAADAAATGGPAVDLHVHDTHFVGLLAGRPAGVFASGRVAADGAVEYLATQYLFGPGGPTVSAVSGAVAAKSRPFAHGFAVYLERATIAHDSDGVPLTVSGPDGVDRPDLGPGDEVAVFAAEIAAAVEGVATGAPPAALRAGLARDALALCLAECESVRTGQPVRVG